VCTTKCDKRTWTQCEALDTRCVLRSFNVAGTPTTKCVTIPEIRDPTYTDCRTDPLNDTMWDPFKEVCRSDCRYLSQAACDQSPLCRVPPAATGQNCTRRCYYKYTDANSCAADPTCVWDQNNKFCAENCTTIAS